LGSEVEALASKIQWYCNSNFTCPHLVVHLHSSFVVPSEDINKKKKKKKVSWKNTLQEIVNTNINAMMTGTE
jgi:hypothetical protein